MAIVHPLPPIMDTKMLRQAFGHFHTGVTVVTYELDGVYFGVTVNSFTSISLDPALVLISLVSGGRAASQIEDRPFTVNVLDKSQAALAYHFAGKPDAANEIPWIFEKGSPRIDGSHAWFSCVPWRTHLGGDHTLFFGEVIDFGTREGEALTFYRGQMA